MRAFGRLFLLLRDGDRDAIHAMPMPPTRVYGDRALRLHPNVPALYVLAAAHELAYLSPATARTLLQRGLRINPESVDLWREYVRMELGYVESLRKRWDVLGVAHDNNDEDDDEGEAARKLVMQGEIVCTVVSNAAKGAPRERGFARPFGATRD